MRVLFIGGTGNISVSVSQLALKRGIDLTLLHRGADFTLLHRGRQDRIIEGARTIRADITQHEALLAPAFE